MADEFVQRQLRVLNREGIHARPATLIVQLANRFQCKVELIKDGQRVDAKSILDLMTVNAGEGVVLLLEARGVDAIAAADAIEQSFKEGLGDGLPEPGTS